MYSVMYHNGTESCYFIFHITPWSRIISWSLLPTTIKYGSVHGSVHAIVYKMVEYRLTTESVRG